MKRLTMGKRSPLTVGIAFIVTAIVASTVLFNKNEILTALTPGDTIEVRFAANRGLVPHVSQAKVSFVPVGVVTEVEEQGDGTVLVSLTVDSGVREKLGTEPSAVIRPTTLLGGNYFVDLVRGGDPGALSGAIPLARTKLPVELDEVARSLQPAALEGVRHSIGNLNQTLTPEGQDALHRLLADAPGTLDPAADVLTALRGEQPADLTDAVSGIESAARVLDEQRGQLDAIVTGLDTTATTLGARGDELAHALRQLPSTLDSVDTGLSRLDGSLARLRDTAGPARPVATELAETLRALDPTLVKADPVLDRLTRVLTDLRPALGGLVPVSRQATGVLGDLNGPVLDRVNGPVKEFVLAPYRGDGPYAGQWSDKPTYQELGYMFANLARASAMVDRNGHAVAIHPGVGAGSVGGLPISLEQLFKALTEDLYLTKGEAGR
jgi:phospholipid/cholesterol/gamma-HCH transport system substrate-binding protein